jgi:hypothetical protein
MRLCCTSAPTARLTRDAPDTQLALSLHAPNQALRNAIVPSASAYKLPALMAAVEAHIGHLQRSGAGGTWTAHGGGAAAVNGDAADAAAAAGNGATAGAGNGATAAGDGAALAVNGDGLGHGGGGSAAEELLLISDDFGGVATNRGDAAVEAAEAAAEAAEAAAAAAAAADATAAAAASSGSGGAATNSGSGAVKKGVSSLFGRKRALIEYVLLSGVNDTRACAHELGALLKDKSFVVNLIPYNATLTEGDAFKEPTEEDIATVSHMHAVTHAV